MDNQAVSQPGTVALEPPSTVLNPQTVPDTSGGGKTSISEPADQGNDSIESVLDAELSRLKAEDVKAEDKPSEKAEAAKDENPEPKAKDDKQEKVEDKPQRARADDGKFAKAEKAEAEPVEGDRGAPEKAAAGQEAKAEERQSEGRKLPDAPARFLPKEKEAWGNVPNVVKSAIARISAEHDTEVQQFRASHEEWTKLDKFQQMAKQHNTTINDALDRYTRFDGLLQSDPITAIREILATRGITPEQYANHVISNPQMHQPRAPQAQPDPVVPQMKQEVESLRNEIQTMRQEQAAQTIIEPFRAGHPRFDELQDDIAFFLQSGKIPASLNPVERLEAAYDMAERINPRSASAPSMVEQVSAAAKTERPANPDAGRKSIRGAPSDGEDTAVEEGDEELTDMLRKQLRRISA